MRPGGNAFDIHTLGGTIVPAALRWRDHGWAYIDNTLQVP